MTAGVRVAAFAAPLAVIFAAAALAGRTIEPGTGSQGGDEHAAGEHGSAIGLHEHGMNALSFSP